MESARKVFLFKLRLISEPSMPSVAVNRFVSGEMRAEYVALSVFAALKGASSSSRSYSSCVRRSVR